MKDITDEMHKAILNDNEEMMKRRKIKVMGDDTHIPYDIFRSYVENTQYYEINNVSEITNDYAAFSDMRRASMKTLKWVMNIAKKSFGHKQFRKELAKLQSTYGDDYNRVIGQKNSFWDKMRMKVLPKRMIYLTEMHLDNFKQVEYPLFSATTFDINDKYGNKIEGVRITEHFMQTMIVNEEKEHQTNEKLKDVRSGSERPFLMQCTAINSDTPRLLVKHMQDGGKKVGVPEITI